MDGIGISGNVSLDMNVQNVVGAHRYDELKDKPKINGVEVSGSKSLDDYGIASKADAEKAASDAAAALENAETNATAIANEVTRAKGAENDLQAAIDKTQVTFPLLADAISATDLKDNDIIATTGFNNAGVGGGIYRVSKSGTANGYTVFACDNGMFLNLMTETHSVFLEQLGADPTGMIPCDSIIKFALDNFKTVIGLNSYRTSDTVAVPSNANLYISRLTNAGTNAAIDFSGGYITACIDNLVSAGNGVIFGNSADTYRFNVTINKIEASGTNAIILGGAYSAFDGVLTGTDAHSKNTPLLVDTSQNFVGQITINNYRLGCDTAGAWLISFPYIGNKANCSGISLMNLSLEGDFNGINIQGTGGKLEYLYGIGIRFAENSFNNHRSFVHIDPSVSVSGDLFTEWLRAIDAFDSTSSNRASTLTIHGHIARADFGVYFTQIELYGPIPVLTANSTFQAAYWTRQGDITLQNIVSEVAFYTSNTARTITYGTHNIFCPANSITVIRSFCSSEGVQVYAFNNVNTDIAVFGLTEPIWE